MISRHSCAYEGVDCLKWSSCHFAVSIPVPRVTFGNVLDTIIRKNSEAKNNVLYSITANIQKPRYICVCKTWIQFKIKYTTLCARHGTTQSFTFFPAFSVVISSIFLFVLMPISEMIEDNFFYSWSNLSHVESVPQNWMSRSLVVYDSPQEPVHS